MADLIARTYEVIEYQSELFKKINNELFFMRELKALDRCINAIKDGQMIITTDEETGEAYLEYKGGK